MVPSNSKEYKTYKNLEHWQPIREILPANKLCDSKDRLYPLFVYLYDKTKEFYKTLPRRKNGELAFVHPVNIVYDLRRAKIINDVICLCAGLIHDFVEEQVDDYKRKNKVGNSKESIKKLDKYETQVFKELEKELFEFVDSKVLPRDSVMQIMSITKLLTRHKRHFYYKSMSKIFECTDDQICRRAIQVKLADRTHNILSIECFNEEDRLNQCFKNLFILNSTKKYLLDKYGTDVFLNKVHSTTERLFNKCAKATYDAFLTICHLCFQKGIGNAKSMIQLAFKKFAFEKAGMGSVTKKDLNERHPMWLFQGIIRKYDARLHQEYATFEQNKKQELKYCEAFFADFGFTKDQLKALIDYKDAYALKESIARLIYQPDYVINRFLWSELSKSGRINLKK